MNFWCFVVILYSGLLFKIHLVVYSILFSRTFRLSLCLYRVSLAVFLCVCVSLCVLFPSAVPMFPCLCVMPCFLWVSCLLCHIIVVFCFHVYCLVSPWLLCHAVYEVNYDLNDLTDTSRYIWFHTFYFKFPVDFVVYKIIKNVIWYSFHFNVIYHHIYTRSWVLGPIFTQMGLCGKTIVQKFW